MLEKIYIDEPRQTDMNMYRCGIEDCNSGHFWGPAVRDHYIIHYILDGKGIFTVGDETYTLGKNDGFLICPETIVYYQADRDDPWSYGWVGFNGFKAAAYLEQTGLNIDNPIFRYDCDSFLKDCLMRMISANSLSRGREIRFLGLLYEFLSQIVEIAAPNPKRRINKKEEYVIKALEYIKMNYAGKITISEIARNVGLDRSYLYSLFNEFVSTSPQKYLINFRIEKACELMRSTILPIGSIACSVGYDDPLIFSKAFKKAKGQSPRDFMKALRE